MDIKVDTIRTLTSNLVRQAERTGMETVACLSCKQPAVNFCGEEIVGRMLYKSHSVETAPSSTETQADEYSSKRRSSNGCCLELGLGTLPAYIAFAAIYSIHSHSPDPFQPPQPAPQSVSLPRISPASVDNLWKELHGVSAHPVLKFLKASLF